MYWGRYVNTDSHLPANKSVILEWMRTCQDWWSDWRWIVFIDIVGMMAFRSWIRLHGYCGTVVINAFNHVYSTPTRSWWFVAFNVFLFYSVLFDMVSYILMTMTISSCYILFSTSLIKPIRKQYFGYNWKRFSQNYLKYTYIY